MSRLNQGQTRKPHRFQGARRRADVAGVAGSGKRDGNKVKRGILVHIKIFYFIRRLRDANFQAFRVSRYPQI